MKRDGRCSEDLIATSEPMVETNCVPGSRRKRQPNLRVRKDKQRLHAMRHAILSQHLLQALDRLGENTRRLRRMESALWAELEPSGIAAEMLFDRLWSSYLRCVVAARAEGNAIAPNRRPQDPLAQAPDIVEREQPTLVWNTPETVNQKLSPDLLRQLLLVQRYDSHFSREMFRCLSLLLLMKNGGGVGLEQSIEKVLGVKRDH